jgi:predicted membrane protein
MKKIAFGLVLIAAGFILMLEKMNMISPEVTHWVFTWQMLLIVIGFVNIFSRESYVSGLVLIMVGAFFLVPRIVDLPFNFIGMFWPILLIGGGVLLILKHSVRRLGDGKKTEDSCCMGPFSRTTTVETDGIVDDFNLFGGSKRRYSSGFRGGKFTNIFGGAEIDLTQAQLENNVAIIETVCVFGGMTLYVPSDWEVQVEVVSILGGFSDKRSFVRTSVVESRKRLIVKGVCVFGGGEIKSI